MVRFCDKEVICLEYDRICRGELISYFLDGNIYEPVCVVDDAGRFFGYITYYSLIENSDTDKAIIKEFLVLNKTIWTMARARFAFCKRRMGEYPLLPVVDEKQNLICFAYEDFDANRELRMLWELQEKADALQFKDIYPKCQCVNIYGFNELAYFFAKYLEILNIPVRVEGSMWEGFFISNQDQFIDYAHMDIYAEGDWPKHADWTKNLLRSVSVEFECIDCIYEKNIKDNRIKDADRSGNELVKYLKNANEVVIVGTDAAAQDAYDYFKNEEINVCCFAVSQVVQEGRKLFGKPILKTEEAMAHYENAVFVDNHDKGSAWGIGETDYFSYLGYRRNRDFFLLKDYIQIQKNSLKRALKDQNIVLAGDFFLCEKLAEYFIINKVFEKRDIRYLDLFHVTFATETTWLKTVDAKEICIEDLCVIAVPEYFSDVQRKNSKERIEKIVSFLVEHGIMNYTDYFCSMTSFINIEKENRYKYQTNALKPKRIIIGLIDACCGNIFFRGLLDGHPSIIMMDYNYLNDELFWLCVRLSGKNAEEIISVFLDLYDSEWEGEKLKNINLFMKKIHQLLRGERIYTSQELFVIFHIAYMYMYGTDIYDPNDMVIYWEAHHVIRSVLEDCVLWLGGEIQCDIVNLVRNLYMRNGCNVKGVLDQNWPGQNKICHIAIDMGDFEKRTYRNSRRLIIRFEDLKCMPEKELYRICREWEITWAESMMHVSSHGKERLYHNGKKQIKGFDLTPVYYTYEEYFSEFDRFKIALICMPSQKKYGYPYVEISMFSRKELQEIFLKEFRFMNRLSFSSKQTQLVFHMRFQIYVRQRIQKLKMVSALKG